jgi:hypothetical protein
MAARVPADLKAQVGAAVAAGDWQDLSTVMRVGTSIALALGHDQAVAALSRLERGEDLLNGSGSAHRIAGATERLAADRATRNATQSRLEVLELYRLAGSNGLTADEVVRELGHKWAPNGLPRRVTDLLQVGAIEQKTEPLAPEEYTAPGEIGIRSAVELDRRPVHRLTRNGSPANVYVITDLGRAALATGNLAKPPRKPRRPRS